MCRGPCCSRPAELAEDELRRGLARLQAAEFVYEAKLFPDLEYTFKHALTHEVAYGSLLQDRRRALHARIVERIERVYADRLAEHVDRLAHHAFRGELWHKANYYLSQTGSLASQPSIDALIGGAESPATCGSAESTTAPGRWPSASVRSAPASGISGGRSSPTTGSDRPTIHSGSTRRRRKCSSGT